MFALYTESGHKIRPTRIKDDEPEFRVPYGLKITHCDYKGKRIEFREPIQLLPGEFRNIDLREYYETA